MRIGYLQIDAAGRTGADNPLTKLKVRQAIFHAIDRQTIADKLVTGGSRVPLAPCYPSQFGCDADAAVKYEYDPAKAKALLAEAGYPNGFDIELVSVMLPQWKPRSRASAGRRQQGAVSRVQVAAGTLRAEKGEVTALLGSWGSYSINGVAAIVPQYFSHGNQDYARDPSVRAVARGRRLDQRKGDPRHRLLEGDQAVMEQAYWMPTHTYVSTYAFSKQLNFTPHSDDCRGSSWRNGIEGLAIPRVVAGCRSAVSKLSSPRIAVRRTASLRSPAAVVNASVDDRIESLRLLDARLRGHDAAIRPQVIMPTRPSAPAWINWIHVRLLCIACLLFARACGRELSDARCAGPMRACQ